jgi:hypothetical protein
MTILKVMFAIAIGTYVAYEITTRSKKGSSTGNGKRELSSSSERIPARP